MAEIFDFYVNDNRTITFKLSEPIMLEDSGVSDWRFHIPNTVNGLDATGWQWWLVYVNARNEKYTVPLTLEYDYDRPDAYSIATYTVDYGMSCKVGNVKFSVEAIDADTGGTILHEWHTKTYGARVEDTLQGNQIEYDETESDIISALLIEVRNRTNQLVGGATPTPVSSVSDMLDTDKLYLLTTDGEWYYYNGTTWVSGGVYGAGVVDAVPTQGSANAVQSGGVYEAIPTIDATLTHSGQAADAKETGDKIGELKSALENLEPGLSDEAKAALLNCFAHVAWIDERGQDYYDELEAALNTYPKIEVVFIPGSSLFYPTDSVDVFKQYLTVKFYETASDTGTTISGSAYTLSGNMYAGINAITVSYEYDGVTYTDAFSAAVGLKWVYPSSAMTTIVGGFTRDDTYLDHSNFADTTKSRMKRLYGAADGDLKFHEYYKNGISSEGIDHTGTVNLYPIPIPSGTTKLTTVFTSSNTSGTTVLQLVKMARSGSNYIANAYPADMSTGDSWTYGSGNDGQYVGIVASNSTEAPVLASLDIVFE